MSYYGGYGMNAGYGMGMMPQYYGGFQSQQTLPQQDQGLIMVNGEEGARAFQLPPNKTVPLFDKNAMMFYLKTTDAGGFGSLRRFSYSEVVDSVPAAPERKEDYLTRAEFEAWKREHDGERISGAGSRRKSGASSAAGESGDT